MGLEAGESGNDPVSFLDHLSQNPIEEGAAVFTGHDLHGPYQAQASFYQDSDTRHVLEIRRYFSPAGNLNRITELINESFGERPIRIQEFSEEGRLKRLVVYGRAGEWVWEKTIDLNTGLERVCVNRTCFEFFSIPEDLIQSIEDGYFNPESLLDIRWEDVREIILEILGAARLIPGLPMNIVDRFGQNLLLKMNWEDRWGAPRMEPWCFLKLHCTTTQKVSYLRVPAMFTDTLSAIAWTFGMDKETYRLDQET